MKTTLKYNVSVATNKGIKSINEDADFLGFNKSGQCLAIICDGIGSQDDSQIASQMTIDTFAKSFNAKNKIHNVKN
jgi:serine/threonine protein phosphatase PrpC